MPITLDEFAKGEEVPTAANPVLRYLLANEDKAYSSEEIQKAVFAEDEQTFVYLQILDNALAHLLRLNLIECRRFKNTDVEGGYTIYYKAALMKKELSVKTS